MAINVNLHLRDRDEITLSSFKTFKSLNIGSPEIDFSIFFESDEQVDNMIAKLQELKTMRFG